MQGGGWNICTRVLNTCTYTQTITRSFEPVIYFKVWVHTENDHYAGTDSNIRIGIFTQDYATNPKALTLLDDPNRDDFEKGAVDGFWVAVKPFNNHVPVVDLTAEPIAVILETDMSGAPWKVNTVVVENPCTGVQTEFLFGKWLGTKTNWLGDPPSMMTIKRFSPPYTTPDPNISFHVAPSSYVQPDGLYLGGPNGTCDCPTCP